MSYIVVYQRADGSSGLEECGSLDLAVVAAERLRNVDSVESPRILKTEEVKFDFRPYYRVEVASEDGTERPTPLSAPASPRSTLSSAPTRSSSTADSTTEGPVSTSGAFVSSAAIADSAPPPPSPLEDVAPAAAPIAETVAAPTPANVEGSDDAETPAEPDVSSATIDPWATADGSSIDYSLQSASETVEDVVDAAGETVAPAAAESADGDQDLASSARGLFSTSALPDPPKDPSEAAQLAEDVSDAVPPRRGLFGR